MKRTACDKDHKAHRHANENYTENMKVRKVGLSVFQSNISLQQSVEMRLRSEETGSAYSPKQLAAPTTKANAVAVCDKDPSGPSFCFVFFSCYAVTIVSDDHLKYYPR